MNWNGNCAGTFVVIVIVIVVVIIIVIVIVIVDDSIRGILFWSICWYVDSLFVVNTCKTDGFPRQQKRTPALSWMLV